MTRETCQAGCRDVGVDDRGRTVMHVTGHGTEFVAWRRGMPCPRWGHPSREELARRKARRVDRLRSLTDELTPDVASVALDAHLLGRAEYADRMGDLMRVAMADRNRRTGERRRWPVHYAVKRDASGLPGGRWSCVYCGCDLHSSSLLGGGMCGADYAAKMFAEHLTQCALEYLAGLRGQETT